jgi:hypothetical protein
MVFSSDTNNGQYDICIYNLKNNEFTHREETPGENEFYTISPRPGKIYFASLFNGKSTLWKGNWSIVKRENITSITPVDVNEIQLPPSSEPEMEKVEEEVTGDMDINLTNYFGPAKYALTTLMKDSLNNLAVQLLNNPGLNIVICGHSSPDGPDNLNMMLSSYRANEAYNWLISRNVDPGRIVRIYGGEYLYSDMLKSRMFSIFTIPESDLPEKIVVYPLKKNENKEKILKQFGIDQEELDYLKFTFKKQLPVDKSDILLLPVKDIHIAQKDETLYGISRQYQIEQKKLAEANNIEGVTIIIRKVLLIPR